MAYDMEKGGALYASEARGMATVGPEDEIERARGIVDRAAKAEAKKTRRLLLM